jgi:hypothetical protein
MIVGAVDLVRAFVDSMSFGVFAGLLVGGSTAVVAVIRSVLGGPRG